MNDNRTKSDKMKNKKHLLFGGDANLFDVDDDDEEEKDNDDEGEEEEEEEEGEDNDEDDDDGKKTRRERTKKRTFNKAAVKKKETTEIKSKTMLKTRARKTDATTTDTSRISSEKRIL